jgi:hypothetical protein
MTMSTMIWNPEESGEVAGRRAGQLYRAAAARGGLADVCALPLRIPEARVEANCMVATDCPETQEVGRFWLSFYAALEAHFPSSEGQKSQ